MMITKIITRKDVESLRVIINPDGLFIEIAICIIF